MYTRNNIKKISNLPVDLWKIEDLYLLFLNILLFYVHANTSSSSTYKRNNMKKILNLPVDRWKIADLYTRNNIKKGIESYRGSLEDRRSFSTPVLRTPNTSSPSTYKRNNMKKILKLPMDLWKIADLFLSLNFTYSFSTYTSTSPHHVNNSHPEPNNITTTNNKTQKPSHHNSKQQNAKTIKHALIQWRT